MDQPVEQKKARAATNPYFTYAPAYRQQQRRYVKSRTPAPVKRRVKKAASAVNAQPQPVLKVAECTAHYLKTLLDPFDQPAGACLPADLFPLPSQKLKLFLRGTCVLGTTGYGYVNAGLTLSNQALACVATSATSVMTNSTAVVSVTNLVGFSYTQLPWNDADLLLNPSVVQGRGVALGLRVRYTGTESNRNGIMNFYEDPDHALINPMSYDVIRQRVNTYTTRPAGDGSWDSIVYSGPVTPSETEFVTQAYLTQAQGGCLICVIKGNPGDTYEFEAFQHIEAIGVNTTGKSASHSDSINYGKAQETVKNEMAIKSLSVSDGPSVIGKFLSKVIEHAPFVIQQGSNVMKALEGNPMALLEGMASSAGLIVKSIAGRQYSSLIAPQLKPALTYRK